MHWSCGWSCTNHVVDHVNILSHLTTILLKFYLLLFLFFSMLYLAIKIAKTISHIKKQKKEKRRYTPSIRTRHGSVQFSCLVVSDSLQPHEPQHTRLPCPSPTSGVHPNPCPSSRWCHPTILSSVVPSPPALNLSQHQGHFKWVSSLHQVDKVLEFRDVISARPRI